MPRSDAIAGAALRYVRRLYNAGSAAGLDDAELLDRFAVDRDQAAFAALVDRHGPMVLATCRSLLRDPHDADDAFQATFLVLARRAGAFRVVGRSLGGWLHGVALRVATRARADRARLLSRRSTIAVPDVAIRDEGADRDDLIAALHLELGRLPERFRRPVVLCDLEGLTHAQAAEALGRGEATVRRRLAEAKALLRSRLVRRGIAPVVSMPAMLKVGRASAEVPEALVAATARAVRCVSLGRGVVGASAAATALAHAAIRGSAIVRAAKAGAIAVAIAASAGIATIALGVDPDASEASGAQGAPNGPDAGSEAPSPSIAERLAGEAIDVEEPGDAVRITGRVVDAAGDPVAGARVTDRRGLFLRADLRPEPVVSGPDGRFELTMPRARYDEMIRTAPDAPFALYAWAVGHSPALVEVAARPGGPAPAEIRLAPDDAMIESRVVDLEGRPVPDVSIRATRAYAPEGGDLGTWLDLARRESLRPSGIRGIPGAERLVALRMAAEVVTDADGRFRLGGVGRNRVIELEIAGPTIASDVVFAVTADVPSFRVVREDEFRPREVLTYYGPDFEHVASPTKPVVGDVRDIETKAPIAGAWIGATLASARENFPRDGVEATADADGRFRLAGLPPVEATDRYVLFVRAPEGSPYPDARFEVRADSSALDPVPFDIELRRGTVVRGRVFDKATGESVPSSVNYYALAENPHVPDFPGFGPATEQPWTPTAPDGRFAVVALPGPGIIAARSEVQGYLPGIGAPEIVARETELGLEFHTVPDRFNSANFQSIAAIEPEPGVAAIEHDLPLDPGRTIAGTVLDPEGEPLAGAEARHLDAFGFGQSRTLPTAEFEARGVDPRRRRSALFVHRERGLAGALPLLGDEDGPLTVRLVPWGAITGRVVDDDGNPVTGIEVDDGSIDTDPTRFDPPYGDITQYGVSVDPGGRFRIEGLVPGLAYQAGAYRAGFLYLGRLFRGVTVKSGEVMDLGDLEIVEDRE